MPWWYPARGSTPPEKGALLREQIKSAMLYDEVNILMFRESDTASSSSGISRYSVDGLEVIDITPTSTGSSIFDSAARTVLWQRGLAMALKQWGRPQVIHCQDMSAFYAGRSASALGIPFVVSQHWAGFRKRLVSPIIKSRCRRTFNRAKVILCSSRSGKDDLRQYGIRGDVRWLPEPVNTSRFTATGSEKRNMDLVHFSGFAQSERVEDIIGAFSMIQHQYPETVLHLAGQGGWRHEMKILAEDQLKPGSFTFPGFLQAEKRAELFRNCRGFVYPSIDNFHSIDLVEAMACGCPSITTTRALYPIQGEKSWALTVKPFDVKAIAEKMRLILEDRHGINTEQVRLTVQERHSRERAGSLIHQAHLDALER